MNISRKILRMSIFGPSVALSHPINYGMMVLFDNFINACMENYGVVLEVIVKYKEI